MLILEVVRVTVFFCPLKVLLLSVLMLWYGLGGIFPRGPMMLSKVETSLSVMEHVRQDLLINAKMAVSCRSKARLTRVGSYLAIYPRFVDF